MRTFAFLCALLGIALMTNQCDTELPECQLRFNPDGTWTPIGWEPYFDGYNNCRMPITYNDHPVVINYDGTWRFQW